MLFGLSYVQSITGYEDKNRIFIGHGNIFRETVPICRNLFTFGGRIYRAVMRW